mmetsp:Transcript_34469/g.107304  ORF Transcript_34469/g.107304 Transcript_34469/m.107304 type:complete len:314 (+) Transcript_34469:794-1735(+)
MSVAKRSVITSSGNSKTGKASKTSLKAFANRCMVPHRRSIFSNLTIGMKQSRMTAGAPSGSSRGIAKPTAARSVKAAGIIRSRRLHTLQKNILGAGLTKTRASSSTVNRTSKAVSINAAATPDMTGGSTNCSKGVATDTKRSVCIVILYHHAPRDDSESSRRRYMAISGLFRSRPFDEYLLTVALEVDTDDSDLLNAFFFSAPDFCSSSGQGELSGLSSNAFPKSRSLSLATASQVPPCRITSGLSSPTTDSSSSSSSSSSSPSLVCVPASILLESSRGPRKAQSPAGGLALAQQRPGAVAAPGDASTAASHP